MEITHPLKSRSSRLWQLLTIVSTEVSVIPPPKVRDSMDSDLLKETHNRATMLYNKDNQWSVIIQCHIKKRQTSNVKPFE